MSPPIVGVGIGILHTVDGFHQSGQVVDIIVGIAYGVSAGTALLHILHHPIGEVKGTEKLSP